MLIPVKDFSIDTTLMAGQTFAWKRLDDGWVSFIDKPILVRQISENELIVTGETSRGEIERRLGLKDDIEKIISSIDKDETIHQAILHSPGLRIVEDGLWVSLLSFVLSIQSNIPLIKKRIEALSSIYGRKETIEGKEVFSFPTYSQIYEHPELLKRAKLGFREKFVLEAANFLQKEELQIENMEKIREKLFEIKGVGDKVLDCVMLYGMHDLSAFPIDVWIKRILHEHYASMINGLKSYKDIRKRMIEYFGDYAGYAQLYLFIEARARRSDRMFFKKN